MPSDKVRIDLLLVERGYYNTQHQAQAAIMAGLVFLGEERLEKAGTRVSRSAKLQVKGAAHPYVSRGGLKLEKALRTFRIDLREKVMLDIGASTGGFTDCALRHGAASVYAVDVGYNQLDWTIRSDPRVYVMERTNFRYLTADALKGPAPEFASIDVSFISLKLILPPLKQMLFVGGEIVALIKPQFETSRERVGRSGVVRDPQVHREVLEDILLFARELGLELKGLTFSPITGGEGNIEFLAYWRIAGDSLAEPDGRSDLIAEVVKEASDTLAI